MTIAERLEQKGRQEGRMEGALEKALAIACQLQKMGDLPALTMRRRSEHRKKS